MSEQASNFDRARGKALGGSRRGIIVEHDGCKYRVCKPSFAAMERAEEISTTYKVLGKKTIPVVNKYKRSMALIAASVFDPDSGKPMFNAKDLPALMENFDEELFVKLTKGLRSLNASTPTIKEMEGNSDGNPSDESSSS